MAGQQGSHSHVYGVLTSGDQQDQEEVEGWHQHGVLTALLQ